MSSEFYVEPKEQPVNVRPFRVYVSPEEEAAMIESRLRHPAAHYMTRVAVRSRIVPDEEPLA